ncbi:MAG: site-2 protease family protein, partial [Halobacteriaceae archaeon]
FDIGVAGPIAGLIMTVIVTIIGLKLPPVHIPPWVFQGPSITIEFGYPPLLQFLAWAVNEPLAYPNQKYLVVNPVVLAGWIGMFVTFLNLIPVGQLDGGHILRAIIGPRQESVAPLVPLALFGLSAYLRFIRNIGNAAGIWIFWGLLTLIFSYVGSATPIQDDAIDTKRIIIGIVTFIIGALCFTPVPVQIGV